MVQIITLPDEEHFLYVDGTNNSPRVMINTGDIKAVEFPQGDDLILTIRTWDKEYEFSGRDAAEVEEFLTSRCAI